jgi:hypothetical protein
VAVVSAGAIDELSNSLDRLAAKSQIARDRDLSDAILRGQMPKTLDALAKKLD